MKSKKLAAIISMFVTSMGALLFVAAPHAFAATKTWVGTDCPSTNCFWSNVNNWSGGVIPVNGDDIVINSDAITPGKYQGTTDDIAGLNVASITTSGYSNAGGSGPFEMYITLTQDLIVTGNITHNIASTAAPTGWDKTSFLSIDGGSTHSVSLGADSTFQNTSLNNVTTLTLGGHTLNVSLNSSYTSPTFSIDAMITGSGTLTINLPLTVILFLNSTNNYSGTTNINTVDYMSSSTDSTKIFGSSTVNLSSQSRILFKPASSGAISITNPIIVTPPTVTGSFLDNQIEFWSTGGANSFTVPNITLLGNASFGVNATNGAVSVNLAGIITNGHCIQYGGGNTSINIDAASFTNGPAACVVAVASGAAAPNTGFSRLSSNPLVVLGLTLVAATSIVVIAKRTEVKVSNKK